MYSRPDQLERKNECKKNALVESAQVGRCAGCRKEEIWKQGLFNHSDTNENRDAVDPQGPGYAGWAGSHLHAREGVIGRAFIHEFKDWDNKTHSRAVSSLAIVLRFFPSLLRNSVSGLGRVECR